jgi:hypothetical protein
LDQDQFNEFYELKDKMEDDYYYKLYKGKDLQNMPPQIKKKLEEKMFTFVLPTQHPLFKKYGA